MWKNYFKLFIVLLCVIEADNVHAKAYTIKVQSDSMYAEVVPKSYLKNAPVVFRKSAKKAMRYYNKYKDADFVTYLRNTPEKYRDFYEVARKLHDFDEIVLHSQYYVYDVRTADEEAPPTYTFLAEKNGKMLCTFNLYIDCNTNKFAFGYCKEESFLYDNKTMYNQHLEG